MNYLKLFNDNVYAHILITEYILLAASFSWGIIYLNVQTVWGMLKTTGSEQTASTERIGGSSLVGRSKMLSTAKWWRGYSQYLFWQILRITSHLQWPSHNAEVGPCSDFTTALPHEITVRHLQLNYCKTAHFIKDHICVLLFTRTDHIYSFCSCSLLLHFTEQTITNLLEQAVHSNHNRKEHEPAAWKPQKVRAMWVFMLLKHYAALRRKRLTTAQIHSQH